jgi:hypothetical protein
MTALAMTALATSQRPACGRFNPPEIVALTAPSPRPHPRGSSGARFSSASNGLDDHPRDRLFAEFRTEQHVIEM